MEKTATICLNMIVKNESHIIEKTLSNLCDKITFSYWVICDTGSTDNTPELIKNFFKNKNIPGQLFYDKWVNFAHNRTIALEKAFNKTDLLLVFDADDELCGDITMPSTTNYDEYHMKFGSPSGTNYTRVLLINNKKRFQYLSVIHEYIMCKESVSTSTVVEGNYYVVSGRGGNRSKDPDKYLKDAQILEEAYHIAFKKDDALYLRYAFYCANSYKDYGRFEDAIKWYKITLGHENQWAQEKYMSCLNIYNCYNSLQQPECGFYYLVEGLNYDKERVECLYPLLVHYCCKNMNNVAYNYYLSIKDTYETTALSINLVNKLFITLDKNYFFLPYYMILIADKKQDFKCVIKMFEIIFIKKYKMFEEWYVKNLLYNLQFFIKHVIEEDKPRFIELANSYIKFIQDNGINISKFDFLIKDVYTLAGILVDNSFLKEVTIKNTNFTEIECIHSKNILFYTGFSDISWNYSYMLNNALGGSEKAVAYLTKCFPKEYNIFVGGSVLNEQVDNVIYVSLNELTNLVKTTPFHAVVVSRYIAFYEMFKDCSYYKSYIWAHDTQLLPYGCNLTDTQILTKWDKYINGCICLTDWHRNLFIKQYPTLHHKIQVINNGIDAANFNTTTTNIKIKNRFMYSSRPERGLNILLELWPKIIAIIPDATLIISSYGRFPCNENDKALKAIIDAHDSIHYMGNLNSENLYKEMSLTEYWLYPTTWSETSCITAIEMLMSEVICIYYPVAGLVNTMENCGIPIERGNEISTILSLTDNVKKQLRENGKKYAESCSWKNRTDQWIQTIPNNDIIISKNNVKFIYSYGYIQEILYDYGLGLKEKYNIDLSDNIEFIIQSKPSTIFFIWNCALNEKIYHTIKQLLPECEICFLNLEPLNLHYRIEEIKNIYATYNIKIYDYSSSNITLLNKQGITNIELLPYINTQVETQCLTHLYNNIVKEYDFGVITGCGSFNNSIELLPLKRRSVFEYLVSNGFTVNRICGYKEHRDTELAKCKIILNIHGQMKINDVWNYSNIFEHIRCDRLLNAGFTILSEDSYNLDIQFITKFPNLKQIKYDDFFILNTYTELLSK
jgi:glycosyltransferase involved in cell wall biosynthesis